ncbi:MAG TPA: beta galactosidase jelly roll domain-containing protein, partial [Bryobacteraceae bacterium]
MRIKTALGVVCVLSSFLRVAFAASVPRPEIPEPQFARTAWQTLNGDWNFRFDDNDEGLTNAWFRARLSGTRKIAVPYCFESKLSGIADTSFHRVMWYERSFTIPSAWRNRHVLLHFGAVDYRAQVWVNGQFLGRHEGGGVPFSFDITPDLKSGTNRLTVRAEDPPTDKSIPRGKQYWEPQSKSIFYTRTSGIWQPVWLESTGGNYLTYVHVIAGQNGDADFHGALNAIPQQPLHFSVDILDGDRAVGH